MMSLMVVCLLGGKLVFRLLSPALFSCFLSCISRVDVLSFILIEFTGNSNDRTFGKKKSDK